MQLTDCRLLVALPEHVVVTATDPTLGGSIPLRAARACTPFLAGNGAGVRLSLVSPVTLRRRLGRTTLSATRDVVERHRALVPLMTRAGLMSAELARRFAAGPCVVERGRAELFTGVFVEPAPGEIVRVGHAGNRRPVVVDVAERLLGAGEGPVPIVLGLSLAPGADQATLLGELASVIRLSPASVEEAGDALAGELVARHAAFFDAAYFADKKRAPTRKYARRARRSAVPAPEPVVARVARLDAPQLSPRAVDVSGGRGGVVATTVALELRAALDVDVTFDGHTLSPTLDPRERDSYATRVSRGHRRHLPDEAHPGARLYLSKYVTPHQAGEPYFFVKPPELVETTRGASTLLVGALGDGWEALSALVETDWFHALPAVLRVHRVGAVVRVARGAPLFTAYPCRRDVCGAPFVTTTWDPFE